MHIHMHDIFMYIYMYIHTERGLVGDSTEAELVSSYWRLGGATGQGDLWFGCIACEGS